MKYTALITLAGVAAGTQAGALLGSFSFENLDSNFDVGSSFLTTVDAEDSTGSVSRLVDPSGTADFGMGFADFELGLQVTNIVGDTADGSGTLAITDTTGDTLTADVQGDFTFVDLTGSGQGTLFFNATLSNLLFNDNSGDGEFNGQNGAFGTDFSGFGPPPFVGALQRLQITDVNFFDTTWGNKLSEIDGQFVPAPTGLALLAMTGVAARRRR
jgi:hypothetical protein